MSERLLFAVQRVTALILAPLVLIHLGLILWAVEGGLTAAEILSRTQGALGWAMFYGVFVLAASAHGAIGLRNILVEWAALGRPLAGRISMAMAAVLLVLGLRGVWAVIA
ncbi:MAG: succinate dehydrogenase [Pseudomonadota bacterium]